MFSNLYSLLTTKNPNKMWLRILVMLLIVILGITLYKQFYCSQFGKEGFEQKDKFILKRDEYVYDNFYAEIYDKLHKPENQVDYLLNFIDSNSQCSKESVFLDVGSGTGDLVQKLKSKGYNVYGIDKSKAMVDKSEEKYPENHCQCMNACDPLAFEKSTFSHVLCVNKTIYEMENKSMFFNNCYFWMKPGGYLIIHLVEPSKFDATVSAGKSYISNPQSYSKTRITDTYIDFIDFNYRAKYDFKNDNIVIVKETFTDAATNNIRQNELTMYMEPIENILKIAKTNGFIVQGKANMKSMNGDENQFLYILERTL
uniref:Methyltransferase type 11 domain-containing protein n=1 Tax=viral metagenome TaxID=1070528 RepID=A0A6C0ER58_9ZZZZ